MESGETPYGQEKGQAAGSAASAPADQRPEAAGTLDGSLSSAAGARQSSLIPQSLPSVQCRADTCT